VLERYGFEAKPEGATLRAKREHHNIVVTGSRWFDNKAGVGGAGAIDLVIHIAKVDFSSWPINSGRLRQTRQSIHSLVVRQVSRRRRRNHELLRVEASRLNYPERKAESAASSASLPHYRNKHRSRPVMLSRTILWQSRLV